MGRNKKQNTQTAQTHPQTKTKTKPQSTTQPAPPKTPNQAQEKTPAQKPHQRSKPSNTQTEKPAHTKKWATHKQIEPQTATEESQTNRPKYTHHHRKTKP